MGVAASDWTRFAVSIERATKGCPAERGAVAHERVPGLRPAEIDDGLAWQAEGEVEGAEPGAGAGEHGLERGPVAAGLDRVQPHARVFEAGEGHGDRFRPPWCGGEVDADQQAVVRARHGEGAAWAREN